MWNRLNSNQLEFLGQSILTFVGSNSDHNGFKTGRTVAFPIIGVKFDQFLNFQKYFMYQLRLPLATNVFIERLTPIQALLRTVHSDSLLYRVRTRHFTARTTLPFFYFQLEDFHATPISFYLDTQNITIDQVKPTGKDFFIKFLNVLLFQTSTFTILREARHNKHKTSQISRQCQSQ